MTTGWQELTEPEAEKHPQETEARTDTRTQTPIHAVVFFSFLKLPKKLTAEFNNFPYISNYTPYGIK